MVDKKPLVSVVLPVYNAEPFLRRCMDSLVFQTLEDIEIVAVNNSSTDNSLEILEEYANDYPDKVKVYTIPHTLGPGGGRNYGIEMARADYIGFSDADDILSFKAMELMYKKAVERNCDIVFAAYWKIEGDKICVQRDLDIKLAPTVTDLILRGDPSFWTKLIHKRLLTKIGKIPEDFWIDDMPYTFVLHSYAQRVGYVKEPIYYYIKRDGSEGNTALSSRNLEVIDAHLYGIKNCNPQYKQQVYINIARHIHACIKSRWIYADGYIKHLKNLWPRFELIDALKNDRDVYGNLSQYVKLTDDPMPRNVFINGFEQEPSEQFIEYIKEKAFYDGCNVTVLNEKNCDVKSNKIISEAHSNGNYEFVAGYFALKAIYEQGGIYIDSRIKIDAPFNYVRYFNAFFSFMDETTYSDWVFGGLAKNEALGSIIKTYDELGFYEDKFYPLSKRIKNILTAEYRIPLNGKTNIFGYPVAVFGPSVMVCNTLAGLVVGSSPHICTHDFSENYKSEDYVVIPKSTLQSLMLSSGSSAEASKFRRENARLKENIKNIETSNAWKLAQVFREISNARFIGKPMKNVFNFVKKHFKKYIKK